MRHRYKRLKHHHHKAPPFSAYIKRLDLHIFYQRRLTLSTATLTWAPPSIRTDGAALAPGEIAFTDVYDSAAVDPTTPIASVPGAAASYTTDVLVVGMHNFTVIVQDTTGHRSAASNTASVDVPAVLANPAAVVDLAASLNP